MASGQPQWISRMLQPTMASASTTAVISSQLVGEPQSGEGVARTGIQASGERYFAIWTKISLGLTMPSSDAGLFLDHLQAFLQVAHLGGQPFVGLLRLRVGSLLLVELLLQCGHVADTAPAEPQLRMNDQQQRDQEGRDESVAPRRQISAGCRTRARPG